MNLLTSRLLGALLLLASCGGSGPDASDGSVGGDSAFPADGSTAGADGPAAGEDGSSSSDGSASADAGTDATVSPDAGLPDCGNGTCDGLENCATCPADCGPCPFCGDTACNGMETCMSCPADCGPCPPGCGDASCNGTETCASCSLDCGPCPSCGDTFCTGPETCASCPGDCGACPAVCDDGMITPPEQCDPPNETSCSATCRNIPNAGNCADGTDNDADLLMDCNDPDCVADSLCNVVGTRIVDGVGLTLQDTSEDGADLAYTDAAGTLFFVPTFGGSPVSVAANVDKARYKGNFLFVYQGLDAAGIATTMLVFPEGSVVPIVTASYVDTTTIIASTDGNHYAYEQLPALAATTNDVYLDGALLFADAISSREAFASTSTYLVVSLWYTDPMTAAQVQTVQSYPVAGGMPFTLVPDGGSKRFSLSPDGASVVVGFNDGGGATDLTLVPITGGAGTLLAPGALNKHFKVLEDNGTLVFLDPTTLAMNKVLLNGTGLAPLVAAGVADIIAHSSQTIVYATAVDAVTALATLRIVRKDGTGDKALGSAALSEGYTSDEGYLGLRDRVVGTAGDLRSLALPALVGPSLVGAGVTGSSYASNSRVAFLNGTGVLRKADLATLLSTVVEDHVAQYRLVPDAFGSVTKSNVAFTVSAGLPGLYVSPL